MQTVVLSTATIAAFGALTVSAACLWIPRVVTWRHAAQAWMVPAAVAMMFALAGGLMDVRGLVGVLTFAIACGTANSAADRPVRLAAEFAIVALCAGFFLHVIPGFANPRVIGDAVLSADAAPYTKYLNFDKGMAGVLLLGLYAPDRLKGPGSHAGARHIVGFLWRFVVVVAVAMALAVASGYVRWEVKLPPWWPVWMWSMLVLTALPEEAAFRGVIQQRIAAHPRVAGWPAVMIAGLLFGLAHLAGGPSYVAVAAVAGVGYGWIYASTKSIAAAIAAHAGLNAIHFVFFTYPGLARGG